MTSKGLLMVHFLLVKRFCSMPAESLARLPALLLLICSILEPATVIYFFFTHVKVENYRT